MSIRASFLRRLTLALLLPLVLLFSQQGALLHELSHWHVPATGVESTAQASSADTDFCLDCLAFAQVAGLAQFDLPVLPVADGLSHHLVSDAARSVAEAALPAPRSRGPPLFA